MSNRKTDPTPRCAACGGTQHEHDRIVKDGVYRHAWMPHVKLDVNAELVVKPAKPWRHYGPRWSFGADYAVEPNDGSRTSKQPTFAEILERTQRDVMNSWAAKQWVVEYTRGEGHPTPKRRADCAEREREHADAEAKAKAEAQRAAQTSWDDIIGQQAAKDALIEALVRPAQHPEVYRRYGLKPARGVLLYGPPGNGKTMLARAAASALGIDLSPVKTRNKPCPCGGFPPHYRDANNAHTTEEFSTPTQGGGFIEVRADAVRSKWYGEAEKNAAKVFVDAQAYHERAGRPAVIFVDEAEAFLGSRSQGLHHADAGILSAFLTGMDGLTAGSAYVILATNRPDGLDPALIRDGRIDRKIMVGPPGQGDAARLVARRLAGVPCAPEAAQLDTFAEQVAALVWGSPLAELRPFGQRVTVPLHVIVSGALITGLVDKAVRHALARELDHLPPVGVCLGDFEIARDQVVNDNARVLSAHVDALRPWLAAQLPKAAETAGRNMVADVLAGMPAGYVEAKA